MSRNFDERYAELINQNVPRKFMHTTSDNSDIPVERPPICNNGLKPPPPNGFIATYCREE